MSLGISEGTLLVDHLPLSWLCLETFFLPILSYIFLMETILKTSRRCVHGRVLGTSEAQPPAGESMVWDLVLFQSQLLDHLAVTIFQDQNLAPS